MKKEDWYVLVTQPIETAFSEGLDLIVDYLKQFTPNYTEYPQTDEVEQEIMEFILNQV
jgi:hypothetical protein